MGTSSSVGGETVAAQGADPRDARRSLSCSCRSPPLQEIADLIGSVTPRPLFKLYTTYNDPWWRSAGFVTREREARRCRGRAVGH